MPLFSRKKAQSSTINMNEQNKANDDVTETEEPSIQTELSLHPNWKGKPEETYVYKFHNNMSPALLSNQLSLYAIELEKDEPTGQVTATVLVRSTIEKGVTLGETPLLLLGPDGETLGKKVFDLSVLGELPANSSRPWKFTFEPQFVTANELPSEDWKLAFQVKKPHQLDLEESWEQSLADQDKEKLEALIKSLKAPKPGEVNFMGLNAVQADDGQLHVTMLIRNGSDKTIQIEKIPLQVTDASGEIVAKGGFTLNQLEVKANTSKPWTFIFPKELLLKDEIDLTTWKAAPIQQS